MTRENLAKMIREKGHYSEPAERQSLFCAQKIENGHPSGITFHLLSDEEHWMIALHGGKRYRCPIGCDIIDISLDLLSGKWPVAENTHLSTLPEDFCKKYGIQ